MVDPTSDLREAEEAPDCATCGDPAEGPRRRVVTWVDEGEVRHRHFCSPDCRERF